MGVNIFGSPYVFLAGVDFLLAGVFVFGLFVGRCFVFGLFVGRCFVFGCFFL